MYVPSFHENLPEKFKDLLSDKHRGHKDEKRPDIAGSFFQCHFCTAAGSEDHGKDSFGAHDERGRRRVCILLADYLQRVAAGRRYKCLVEQDRYAGKHSGPGRPLHYEGDRKACGSAEEKLQLG